MARALQFKIYRKSVSRMKRGGERAGGEGRGLWAEVGEPSQMGLPGEGLVPCPAAGRVLKPASERKEG